MQPFFHTSSRSSKKSMIFGVATSIKRLSVSARALANSSFSVLLPKLTSTRPHFVTLSEPLAFVDIQIIHKTFQ